MPLFIEIADNNPFAGREGMACFFTATKLSLPIPAQVTDVCRCNSGCEPVERVFCSSDGDIRKNDKSQFMYAKSLSGDTVAMILVKGLDEYNLLSGDYGKVWEGFTAAPLQVGIEIDWKKVYTAHGSGRYYVKTNLRIGGRESEIVSRAFDLSIYSDLAANGTVKIESYQTGDIIGSNLIYTGIRAGGWLNQFRIKGSFGQKTPVLTQDNYVNNNYATVQIQDKITTEYTLTSNYLTAEVANALFFRDMLANKILITNYDINSYENYNRIDVVPADIIDSVMSKTKVRQSWKFNDRIDNNFKSNY